MTDQISPPNPLATGPDLTPQAEPASTNATPAKKNNLKNIVLHAGAIVVATVITIGLFLVIDRETIMQFQRWGYFGIFLTSLIGNASIALPIPSLFFTFVGGGTFNWVIVGLVSGVGEALGESTGYLAGYGGSAIIEDRDLYQKMHGWMEKYGGLTLFVLSVVPNPVIDLAGIAAGASKFGYFRFLVYCWAGKTIKTMVFAYAGAHSVNWLLHYIDGFIG